jgi:hypothetical protein
VAVTAAAALSTIVRNPHEVLWRQWNWKSALYSSLCRAGIFFAVNATAGYKAAAGAMLAEFTYRAVTAGFYGSLTQSFRRVEPRWHGTACALALLVTLSHSLELLVHWLRGTPNLGASIAASMCFTVLSTLFNLHAMRQGVFVTDHEARSLWEDLRSLPRVLGAANEPECTRIFLD